jgi:hypothetical protein
MGRIPGRRHFAGRTQSPLSQLPCLDELAQRAPPVDSSLSELQFWMVELLRHERSLEKSELMRDATAQHFTGNGRLSPAAQINLYRQQFWLRHTAILIEDFPGLTGLLGQKKWEKVSQSYLTTRGYCVESLRDLGGNMAEHLSKLDIEYRRLLVDMALVEWAYVEAFDAEDDVPLDPTELSKIPVSAWESARFTLSQSISLLSLSYPTSDIRRNLKRAPGDAQALLESARPEELYLVVYRRQRDLFDKKISRPAFLLLQEFSRGTPLIEACASVVRNCPDAEAVFDAQLFSWFSLWGRLGWITGVSFETESSNRSIEQS